MSEKLQLKNTLHRNKQRPNKWGIVGGIGFTFLVAALGYLLSYIPGFAQLGPLASAILLAIVYRQIWGYPHMLQEGIHFSAKKLLRVAIILYGLKLNVDIIMSQGLGLLMGGAITILFSLAVFMLLAKWLKADFNLSFLLAAGTGICGAAAIAAVSPIIKAKDEDTAMGVGIIALVGTVFAIGYTILWPFLPITAEQYGIWTGLSLHEIAHVALAGEPAGTDALAMALLAKLGRVFLLVPFCFLLIFWMKRSGKIERGTKVDFPWFLLGFVFTSLIGSYVIGKSIIVPDGVLTFISQASTYILTMAMVGLGLNVSFRDVRAKAAKPFIIIVITSLLLSLVMFFIA